MWLFSVAFILLASFPAMVGYMIWRYAHGLKATELKPLDQSPELVIFLLIGTLGAQLLTIWLSYKMVTRLSHHAFLEALGWHWHERFRLPHTLLLTFLIFVLVTIISSQLPNDKTDLQRILESSVYARVITALLAVVTAPFVEEVIYRGILYAGIRKAFGVWPAVAGVSILFLGVHVPQYWGGWGVLASLGALSLILTLVRAFTGSLLPCFVIHLLFNGVQAIGIIAQGLVPKQ